MNVCHFCQQPEGEPHRSWCVSPQLGERELVPVVGDGLLTPSLDEVPCILCDVPTISTGTKLCDNCWELNQRLPALLRSPKGRAFVRRALGKATNEHHAQASERHRRAKEKT